MRKLRYMIIIPVLLAAIYLSGPRLQSKEINSDIPDIQFNGQVLEDYVNSHEADIQGLKEDNQARIIWYNDSLKNKTEYAIVYLHGFSASQGEGFPVHEDLARRYGCNLYLTRLYGHGLYVPNALENMTPANLAASAAQAIAIGRQLGRKVILLSTSTGGTLSLYFAAKHPDLTALILYSPNIRINNPSVFLLTNPWGLQIGRLVNGGKMRISTPDSREDSLYWTQSYRMKAVVYLQSLINQTMRENIFRLIHQPVFLGYYYKNEEEQDPVVRVDAMHKMFKQLGTPDSLKWQQAFPDAGTHVIACAYKSGAWQEVEEATCRFMEDILHINPVDSVSAKHYMAGSKKQDAKGGHE